MLATRPISRNEAARLVSEAQGLVQGGNAESSILGVVDRLGREFRAELEGKDKAGTFLKPADSLSFEYFHSDGHTVLSNINNDGDEWRNGNNGRVRFAVTGRLLGHISLYAAPEWRGDSEEGRVEAETLYLKLGGGPLEVLAGRDSMWWGASSHGTLLLSNNARPFDMVKISTWRPLVMPWIFRPIGLVRPTVFLTTLEKDRFVPNPNLLGMRLDFKPLPGFRFAVNRLFMFGGEGRQRLDFSDWINVFIAADSTEHGSSPTDGNQLFSLDLSFIYVSRQAWMPFSGIKLYTEWGAEDSSGDTKTPSNKANICGVLIDEPLWLKDTDVRVEWANTARHDLNTRKWYTHHIFRTGHTFGGRFIGHHAGGDSRDLFVRVRHHFRDLRIGAEFDYEKADVHDPALKTQTRWYAIDSLYRPAGTGLAVSGKVGIEYSDGPSSAGEDRTSVVWLNLEYSF